MSEQMSKEDFNKAYEAQEKALEAQYKTYVIKYCRKDQDHKEDPGCIITVKEEGLNAREVTEFYASLYTIISVNVDKPAQAEPQQRRVQPGQSQTNPLGIHPQVPLIASAPKYEYMETPDGSKFRIDSVTKNVEFEVIEVIDFDTRSSATISKAISKAIESANSLSDIKIKYRDTPTTSKNVKLSSFLVLFNHNIEFSEKFNIEIVSISIGGVWKSAKPA